MPYSGGSRMIAKRLANWIRLLSEPRGGRSRLGTFCFAAGAVGVVLLIWPEARAAIWQGSVLDLIVIFTVIVLLGLSAGYLLQTKNLVECDLRALRERYFAIGGSLLAIAGLYVSYATFRNQTRLTAQQALNEEVMSLYVIEMGEPDIRCIYYNYGFPRQRNCLTRIVSDPEKWSLAIFYVEEAWYALKRGRRERIEWGSDYSNTVQFWIEDLGRDPTGLFSYYLVASEETLDDAVNEMRLAGVHAEKSSEWAEKHLCHRFAIVWQALGSNRPRISDDLGATFECLALVTKGKPTGLIPAPTR